MHRHLPSSKGQEGSSRVGCCHRCCQSCSLAAFCWRISTLRLGRGRGHASYSPSRWHDPRLYHASTMPPPHALALALLLPPPMPALLLKLTSKTNFMSCGRCHSAPPSVGYHTSLGCAAACCPAFCHSPATASRALPSCATCCALRSPGAHALLRPQHAPHGPAGTSWRLPAAGHWKATGLPACLPSHLLPDAEVWGGCANSAASSLHIYRGKRNHEHTRGQAMVQKCRQTCSRSQPCAMPALCLVTLYMNSRVDLGMHNN